MCIAVGHIKPCNACTANGGVLVHDRTPVAICSADTHAASQQSVPVIATAAHTAVAHGASSLI